MGVVNASWGGGGGGGGTSITSGITVRPILYNITFLDERASGVVDTLPDYT